MSASTTTSGIVIDPSDLLIFKKRHDTLVMDNSKVTDMINEILLEYNRIFDVGGFSDFVCRCINEIPPEFRTLVIDSIEFANILLRWRIRNILCSDDLSSAIMFAILVWHVSMAENRSTSTELIDRYFQMDLRKMQSTARKLLLEVHEYLGETESEVWSEWEETVMDIIDATPLIQHYQVMSSVNLFSDCIIFDGEKCDWFRSMEICRLIFVAATESFMFHTPDMSRQSHRIVNRDFEAREQQINQFIACLFSEYTQPLMGCLSELCEHGFIRKFCENITDIELQEVPASPARRSSTVKRRKRSA